MSSLDVQSTVRYSGHKNLVKLRHESEFPTTNSLKYAIPTEEYAWAGLDPERISPNQETGASQIQLAVRVVLKAFNR